jgi:CRP/FNR family cyclic AMP-dependent transcriptional regulator
MNNSEEDVKKYSALLKEVNLFYGLSDHQIDLVNDLCKECSFAQDQMVFHENSRDTELYIVIDGAVGIIINPSTVSAKPNSNGKKEIIATIRPGQIFGEMALADEGIRSAGAISLQNGTRMLQIERNPLLNLCQQEPDLGYKVMFNLANELAMKIRTTDLQIRAALLKSRD